MTTMTWLHVRSYLHLIRTRSKSLIVSLRHKSRLAAVILTASAKFTAFYRWSSRIYLSFHLSLLGLWVLQVWSSSLRLKDLVHCIKALNRLLHGCALAHFTLLVCDNWILKSGWLIGCSLIVSNSFGFLLQRFGCISKIAESHTSCHNFLTDYAFLEHVASVRERLSSACRSWLPIRRLKWIVEVLAWRVGKLIAWAHVGITRCNCRLLEICASISIRLSHVLLINELHLVVDDINAILRVVHKRMISHLQCTRSDTTFLVHVLLDDTDDVILMLSISRIMW